MVYRSPSICEFLVILFFFADEVPIVTPRVAALDSEMEEDSGDDLDGTGPASVVEGAAPTAKGAAPGGDL